MKWLTEWFLDNPVAANLLMVLILAGGVLSFNTIRVESFPQLPPSQLVITVAYPGGTARQVDNGITQRIEDAISSVAGISRISSESSRGLSTVRVKKSTGTDLDRLLENVRNQVSSIAGFPEQAEKPVILRDEFTNLAMFVMVAGEVDDAVLQQSAAVVEKALKRHQAISKVTNLGKRKPQLLIEPDPERLERYGLSIADIAARIRDWSLEYRSGELKTAQGALVLRGDGYADNLVALRRLPVVTNSTGTVALEQVANIVRGYQDDDSVVRFQGKPAIAMMVSTSQKDNLFRVGEAVNEVLSGLGPQLPAAVELDVMADMTPYIKDQLNLLGTNAWQGLIIVLVLLGLFLELRLAFWVAVGIPVSLAGALALMPVLNYSINDITLFGMILVLGVLVDDAVVVGESIHTARGKIADPRRAAGAGVNAVAVATTYGVLTTIAAFSPMLWIENELAQVLAGFSAVVILALIFSLIESKFILPTHLAHGRLGMSENIVGRLLGRARKACLAGLDRFSVGVYQPVLRFSLHNRVAVLLLFIVMLVLAYGLVFRGEIRSAFFPDIPGRYITVNIDMDRDAPVVLTRRNARQLEHSLKATQKVLQQKYQLQQPPVRRYLVAVNGSRSIEITAEITTEALRKIPGRTLLKVWQQQTGAVEGSYATRFSSAEALGGGTEIAISAPDRELAREASRMLQTKLKQLPGVNNVYDDSQGGQRQVLLKVNRRGQQLGITQRQLATVVGGSYGSLEVYRLLDNGEETQVKLQLPESLRKSLEQLRETPVRVADNSYVRLGEVAEIHFEREPEVIQRRNREEVVTVGWRQNRQKMSPEAVWSSLQQTAVPQIERQLPGVSIRAVGEFEEISEVQTGFRKAMLLTLLLIYILMAVPLKSYWQPLIIMSVIPFGFAGAIYGHGLMGLPVSVLSLFGMMAMTGVVVNDSLVLMTRFNQLCDEGMSVTQALIEAGRSRLRAIFLTTVTTVFGLLPLLSETSEQAQYLKPAAVSLVFGELFATPITLILIPVLLAFGRYRQTGSEVILAAQTAGRDDGI